MPIFVRMIARAKWERGFDLEEGEIAADSVTGDLTTTQNGISFWRRPDADVVELESAALGIS